MSFGALDEAAAFATIAQNLASRSSLRETLEEIVGTAVGVIHGCESAGVLMVGTAGRLGHAVASAPAVRECEEAQLRLREGPCVPAELHFGVVQVDDLHKEPRWPRFARAAVELGMRSMLCVPLTFSENRLGALNLYAGEARAFGRGSVAVGSIFATHAAIAIASARLEEQLRGALQSRGLIGQAIGILMERHHLGPDAALELLKLASQHRNVRVRALAEDLVARRLDASDLIPARAV